MISSWSPQTFRYFTSKTQLGGAQSCVPNGAVVSWRELSRRGQPEDRIKMLTAQAERPPFVSASADEVRNAKIAVKMLDDADKQLEADAAEIQRKANAAAKPSELAALLHPLLVEWHGLESELMPLIGKCLPTDCNPPWLQYTRNAFVCDHLETAMNLREHFIRSIVDALKPDIANLEGIDLSPIQRFVHTMTNRPMYSLAPNHADPNADWLPAKNIADLLPSRLALREKAAADKWFEEQGNKGLKGFAKGVAKELKSEAPKKVAGLILGLGGWVVAAVLFVWTHRAAIIDWITSHL